MIVNKTFYIALILLFSSCTNHVPMATKIVIPKPVIIEINPYFKPLQIEQTDQIYTIKNLQDLLYNIKMSRIYFNQCKTNIELIQQYYDNALASFNEN